MTPEQALEIVRREMACFCHHYEEERGKQCPNLPVWTLYNIKFDTNSRWCNEHKPERAHFADRVLPFQGGRALKALQKDLKKPTAAEAKTKAKKKSSSR